MTNCIVSQIPREPLLYPLRKFLRAAYPQGKRKLRPVRERQ